ncbi:MAG: hypothetical protein R6V46_12175 [Desulfatiglandaceae bacterium]
MGFGSLVMYGPDRPIPQMHPQRCAQEQGCNPGCTGVDLIVGMFLYNVPGGSR